MYTVGGIEDGPGRSLASQLRSHSSLLTSQEFAALYNKQFVNKDNLLQKNGGPEKKTKKKHPPSSSRQGAWPNSGLRIPQTSNVAPVTSPSGGNGRTFWMWATVLSIPSYRSPKRGQKFIQTNLSFPDAAASSWGLSAGLFGWETPQLMPLVKMAAAGA